MPTFARGALPAIVDKYMASQSANGVVKYCANQNATPVCSLQIFFFQVTYQILLHFFQTQNKIQFTSESVLPDFFFNNFQWQMKDFPQRVVPVLVGSIILTKTA